MHRLTVLACCLGLATACSSSSEARPPATETAKPVEAKPAPKVEPPKPAEAPKPASPKREPLPLTQGNGHRQIGLRTLEELANAIDAAGDDCVELARTLTLLSRPIAKAIARFGEHGQQFKTLPMSKALRDRQKEQRPFVKRCTASEPLAKTAYAKSIGAITSYDSGYDGERAPIY